MGFRRPRASTNPLDNSDTELTADLAASEVMDVVPMVMRFVRSEMRRHGGSSALSVPQFRALNFLSHEPGASLSAVAEHLGVTLGTASSTADRLVQHGLITRAAHPAERRRITLNLTPAGSQLLQNARQATRARVASVLAGVSEEELRRITDGLALLGDAFRVGRKAR
jgi:DNA-binding MarR family transcriptional regulator